MFRYMTSANYDQKNFYDVCKLLESNIQNITLVHHLEDFLDGDLLNLYESPSGRITVDCHYLIDEVWVISEFDIKDLIKPLKIFEPDKEDIDLFNRRFKS